MRLKRVKIHHEVLRCLDIEESLQKMTRKTQRSQQKLLLVREAKNAELDLRCESTLLITSVADGSGKSRGESIRRGFFSADVSVVPEAKTAGRGWGGEKALSIVESCGVDVHNSGAAASTSGTLKNKDTSRTPSMKDSCSSWAAASQSVSRRMKRSNARQAQVFEGLSRQEAEKVCRRLMSIR